MAQNREQLEKLMHALELKLASEKDNEARYELREHIAYLRDKVQSIAEREYAEDVRDDYRFRRW